MQNNIEHNIQNIKTIASNKISQIYPSLIDSEVIDAGFCRENHSSISVVTISRGLKPLDAKTDSKPD